MSKVFGIDSFEIIALTTTARRLVTSATGKRQVQSAILYAPVENTVNIKIGGPTSQVFTLIPGASLNLGDLFSAVNKTEVDMYHVWIKTASATADLEVVHDAKYQEDA